MKRLIDNHLRRRIRGLGAVAGLGLSLGLGGCNCGEPAGFSVLAGALEIRDGRATGATGGAIEVVDLGEVPVGVPTVLPLIAANVGTAELLVCVEGADASPCGGRASRFEPAAEAFSFDMEGSGPKTEGWVFAPGESREVSVRFAPSSEGPVESTLILAHDGENGPEGRVRITAVAIAPSIDVEPAELDFGSVTVGRRRSLEVAFHNRTPFPQSLEIPTPEQSAVVFGLIDAEGREIPTGTALSAMLPADGTLRVQVFFQPEEEVDYVDTFSIRFCPNCERSLPVRGNGIRPVFEIDPPLLDFGEIGEEESVTRTFTIFNRSERFPVAVEEVGIAGTNSNFAVMPRAPVPLAIPPGESLVVDVRYAGQEPSTHVGQVEVRTDAFDDPDTGLDESLGTVLLEGRTIGPNIDAFPDVLSFGTVALGSTPVARTVLVQNTGTSPLTISAVRLEAETPEISAVRLPIQFPLVLAPSASQVLELAYAPSDPGVDRAELVIESDDRNEPRLVVPVVGIGGIPTTCAIAVAPSVVTFGLVERGRRASLAVEIRNSGAQPCTLSGIALTGAPEMSLRTPPPATVNVAPGQRHRIDIAYAPTAYGTHEALLTLRTDDPAQPSLEVPVRGASAESEMLVIPSQVDFNVVPVRCASPARQVTIYNTGASRAQVTRIYLDPTTSSEFELSAESTPVSLGGGESMSVDLRYRPTDIGLDTGVLFIEHTAAPAPVAVPLSGEGQINPTVTDTFSQLAAPQADVLFVVDNSCSMSQEQASLGANLGAFLQFARGANIDFQIGVVTTDTVRATDRGRFRGDPRIIQPTTPNGDDVFAATVNLGTGGSGAERGLEAAYLALSDPLINTHNAGFLRASAALAVIFVSDEPDSSNRPLSFYESFLRNIKGFNNSSMFSASAVVGTSDPECSGPGGVARYAPRYIALAQATGGVVESICSASWGQTLSNIGLNSFGLRRQFTLSSAPVPSTISVRVDGAAVPRTGGAGDTNWSFDASTNILSFEASRVPPEGSTINVTYSVACLP